MNDQQFNDFFSRPNEKSLMPKELSKNFDSLMKFPKMDQQMQEMMGLMNTNLKDLNLDANQLSQKLSKDVSKNENGYSFVHTSITKFDDKGQKYKKTHSLTTGPDGVKQEQKTLEDRDQQYKEMKLGNHIKNRGIEIEKSKKADQPIQTKKNVYGMDPSSQEQMQGFEKDWEKAVGASSGLLNIGYGVDQRRIAGSNGRKKLTFN